jgi:hypothetical protein
MPELGTLKDFIDLWPLWLFLGGLILFVYKTRDREPPRSHDAFGQQMADQRRVNSLFNFGAMFGRRD